MWTSYNGVILFLFFPILWKNLSKIGVISYLIFDIIHQHSHLELGLKFFFIETLFFTDSITLTIYNFFLVSRFKEFGGLWHLLVTLISIPPTVMSPFHSWHWLLMPFLWSALQGFMNFISLSKEPDFQLPYLFLCRIFLKLISVNSAVSSFYFLKLNFLFLRYKLSSLIFSLSFFSKVWRLCIIL